MEILIALFLMATQDVAKPSYKQDSCHSSDRDYGIIQVTKVLDYDYNYKVWLNGHWSKELINSSSTIESVYNKLVKCP